MQRNARCDAALALVQGTDHQCGQQRQRGQRVGAVGQMAAQAKAIAVTRLAPTSPGNPNCPTRVAAAPRAGRRETPTSSSTGAANNSQSTWAAGSGADTAKATAQATAATKVATDAPPEWRHLPTSAWDIEWITVVLLMCI